jgi:integrase
MASYEFHDASGRYHLRFRYQGKPFKRALRLENDREAERVCGVIEETLKDLKRGRLAMPGDADPGAFLISGGQVASAPAAETVSETCQTTLGGLFSVYQAELTAGAKEANSLSTEDVHRRHLDGHFGKQAIAAIDHRTIQGYVNARSKAEVVAVTIRKELATLRMIWNWGQLNGHVGTLAPWESGRLVFPKEAAREPFQTWEQIERKITAGRKAKGWTVAREESLWECLYLDEAQIQECLAFIEANARYPFLYPMFCFCAYTGARRSEILRSEREDWDFQHGSVALRQKKSDTSKTFTLRHVPIHPALVTVMRHWFQAHPGGPWTICTENAQPIGGRMATKYFRGTVDGGKWGVLHGFHIFRHSLASIMASKGIDQRVINEILGHSTVEMERRYRHLFPQKREGAMAQLFG